MSNTIKILLVLLIPVLLITFVLFSKKDKKNTSSGGAGGSSGNGTTGGETSSTPCVTLGRVEYLEEKRIRKQRIKREITGDYDAVHELLAKYRAKALAAGKLNTADEILEFACWAEADIEMKEDGYCYIEV